MFMVRNSRWIVAIATSVVAVATAVWLLQPCYRARQTIAKWGAAGAVVSCDDHGEVELLLALNGFDPESLNLLKNSNSIHILVLADTRTSDVHVTALKELRHLRSLCVSRTGITNLSLADFAALPRLETLVLDDTSVSDAGLPVLRGMQNLRHLSIRRTSISVDGLNELRQDLPDTEIAWEAR